MEPPATLPEAIGALRMTVQEVYHSQELETEIGVALIDLAERANDAWAAGDVASAFRWVEQAHGQIEASQGLGQITSEDAAIRLHRAFDVIAAVIASNPPTAGG